MHHRRKKHLRTALVVWSALGCLTACGQPELRRVSFLRAPEVGAEGDLVEVEAFAADASGETVTFEVFGVPELSKKPRLLEVHTEKISANYASLRWTIDGEILEFEGDNELFFQVSMNDQALQSERIPVPVRPEVESVTLSYEGPTGRTALAEDDLLPQTVPLIILAQTKGLGSRETLTLEIELNGQVVETVQAEINDRTVGYRFVPESGFFGGASSVPLRVRARSGTLEAVSARVNATARGIYECEWLGTNGTPLDLNVKLGVGINVRLFVRGWGLDNEQAVFELWEDDPSNDDFVGRFTETIQGGIAEAAWTTEFMDDGVFNDTNEFFYNVGVSGLSCSSQNLEVDR